MKLIFDNFPMENEEADGNIEFIMDGYFYNIGQLDDICWISRMTIDDYENGRNNWEKIGSWVPENKPVFRLLSGDKLP